MHACRGALKYKHPPRWCAVTFLQVWAQRRVVHYGARTQTRFLTPPPPSVARHPNMLLFAALPLSPTFAYCLPSYVLQHNRHLTCRDTLSVASAPLYAVFLLLRTRRGAVFFFSPLRHRSAARFGDAWMIPWRRYMLTARATRHLGLYDPAIASVTVDALGDLGDELPTSPGRLLARVSPVLPHCDAAQLLRLFRGFSKLRVAHYMATAHLLQLFLAALAEHPVASAELAALQLGAVAQVTHVVQQHHTQRTTRAFLAAVEAALRPARGRLGVEECGHAALSFAAARGMASQLLFVLEVHVNVRVCVQAPHTPSWLLERLASLPADALSLRELLHVYARGFPVPATPASDTDAATVRPSAAASRRLLTHRILSCLSRQSAGRRGGGAAAETDATAPDGSACVEAAWGEQPAWARALSCGERHTLVRCVVDDWAAGGAGRPDDTATMRLLTSIATPALFWRVTKERGWRLRGAVLDRWLAVLSDFTGRDAHARGPSARRSGPVRLSGSHDAAPLCVALLQIVFALVAGEDLSETSHRRGCSGTDAAEMADRRGQLQWCVQELLFCLRIVSADENSDTAPTGYNLVEWELLALLLSLHHSATPDAADVPERRLTELTLQQIGESSPAWCTLMRASRDTLGVLLARWLQFWHGHNPLSDVDTMVLGRRVAPTNSALQRFHGGRYGLPGPQHCLSPLEHRLHWAIADFCEALLPHTRGADVAASTAPLQASAWQPLRVPHAALARVVSRLVVHTEQLLREQAGSARLARDGELEVDLVLILAESLERARRRNAALRAMQPPVKECVWLADVMVESAVPGLLAAAMRRTSAGGLCAAGSGRVPSYAATRHGLGRWHGRLWWAATAAGAASEARISPAAAQATVLHAVFPPGAEDDRIDCGVGSSCAVVVGLREGVAWPLEMLATLLRNSHWSSQPEPAAVAEAAVASTPLPGDDFALLQTVLATLSHGVDAQDPTTGTPPLLSPLWGSADCVPTVPAAPLAAPASAASAVSLFSYDKGLANTFMCNVELLLSWSTTFGEAATCTLRGGGEYGSGLPSLSPPHGAAQHDLWFRDDALLTLRRDLCLTVCGSAATCEGGRGGTQAGHPAPSPSPLEEAEDTVAAAEVAALTARALHELRAELMLRSASCQNSASPAHTWAFDAMGVPHGRPVAVPFVPVPVNALHVELCQRLWHHCRHVAALLVPCGGARCSGVPVGALEAALLGAVTEAEHCTRGSQAAARRCSESPVRDTSALATTRHATRSALMGLLWGRAHASCHEEASPMSVVTALQRLRLFADHLCVQLPLSGNDAPSHARLLCCLEAVLSDDADAAPRACGPADPALSCAVTELRVSLQGRLWCNGETSVHAHRPFHLLQDTAQSMCGSLGIDFTSAAPLEAYAQHLLSLHPFLSAERIDAAEVGARGVQFVALTWLHVVWMQCLAANHPRLRCETSLCVLQSAHSHIAVQVDRLAEGTSLSRTSSASGSCPAATSPRATTEAALAHQLALSLACELQAAVSSLISALTVAVPQTLHPAASHAAPWTSGERG